MSNKMWGGRFASAPHAIMEEINASIDFDRKLALQDIAGSKAHVAMLAKTGIVTREQADAISAGLEQIRGEIESGSFTFSRALEDIHMNIEARLAEIVGPDAGRLHTARSRNDQVALDFRLWVRDTIDALDAQIADLQLALAEKALAHAGTVMPGFTHLQTAQPVTFGHHLLAYVEMLARDRGRLRDARARLNESPLGAAALAGTSFPIDREMTARALGFERPTANSLDSVSDRDFALETLAAASICVGASLALCRRDRAVDEPAIRLRRTVGRVHDRLVDHAAEAQSRCGRTRARQDRANFRCFPGAACCHEGSAARLFQGHAGRQGRHVRRAAIAVAVPRRHGRHGPRSRTRRGTHAGCRWCRATLPQRTSQTGSFAGSGCRSAKRTT